MNTSYHSRFHPLKLTYSEFKAMHSSIANCQIEKYYVYEKIDSGAFGSIYIGMDDQTKKIVAVKLLDLEEVAQEKSSKVREIRQRLCESQPLLMMACDSENIVKCYDVYYNESLKIMMIEYCNGKNLQHEIDSKGRIPEAEAILIMRQLINGLVEMHRNRIIHRDLKAENILSHNGVYKIADLGFSKRMDRENQIIQTTLGTITTMAPEVMQKKKYGVKADIWSLGVIFFQMVYGKEPYDSKSANRMYQEITNKVILNTERFTYNGYTASKEVTGFLKQVLVVESKDRLNWKQLESHPLFRDSQRLDAKFYIRTSFKPLEKQESSNDNFLTNQEYENNLPRAIQSQQLPHLLKRVESTQSKFKNEQIAIIKRNEEQLNQWVHKCYLECLKTELIYYQIVEKIIQNELYDISERDVIEMIYLLLTRGRNNIGVINFKLRESNESNEYILCNLKETVSKLYAKVTKSHEQYGNKLTQCQDKITSMIFDRISSIFSSDKKKEKDVLLGGFQGTQFSKKSQIEFTYNNYLKEMADKMNATSGTNINYIRKLMEHYVDINNITLEDLQASKLTFNEYIEKMIFK